MPVITLECAHITVEQKRELVAAYTKTTAQVLNIPEQAFIVLIHESDKENIGVGGILLADK